MYHNLATTTSKTKLNLFLVTDLLGNAYFNLEQR